MRKPRILMLDLRWIKTTAKEQLRWNQFHSESFIESSITAYFHFQHWISFCVTSHSGWKLEFVVFDLSQSATVSAQTGLLIECRLLRLLSKRLWWSSNSSYLWYTVSNAWEEISDRLFLLRFGLRLRSSSTLPLRKDAICWISSSSKALGSIYTQEFFRRSLLM